MLETSINQIIVVVVFSIFIIGTCILWKPERKI